MISSLAEKIAGEVVLSETPGATIRKWRETFKVSQFDLSEKMDVRPSVISDYENGRIKSPGIGTVRRLVDSLFEIDEQRGGDIIKKYSMLETSDAIKGIGEYPSGTRLRDILDSIKAKTETSRDTSRLVYGFTIVDSLKAVMEFNSQDYLKVYGWSTERVLVFTDVHYGRSPMIAIRAHPMKPAAVVFQRPDRVDPLAIKLAELEGVVLASSDMDVREMKERLEKFV